MKTYWRVSAAAVLLLAGCTNTRYAAQPMVKNVGDQVATRYRYKFADYYRLEGGRRVTVASYRTQKADMERLYPDVFSDDGIPFVLRKDPERDFSRESNPVEDLLCLCSALLLPVKSRESVFVDETIEFPDDGLVKRAYTVRYVNDEAASLSSLAAECYNECPAGFEEWPLFWKVSRVPRTGDSEEKFSVNRQAVAYGAAVTLKELEDAGRINVAKLLYKQPSPVMTTGRPPAVPSPLPPPSSHEPLYSIISCERESGSDFSYRFVLELTGKEKSLQAFRSVQKEFRSAVREDYAESFPGVRLDSLFVDFPEYKLNNGKIEGRAVVLSISIVSLAYDPNTRKGRLSVRYNANQYEEARKWVRKNIEMLARDKNVALTTGAIPPAARFYLGREELKDGNILEIEFKTE